MSKSGSIPVVYLTDVAVNTNVIYPPHLREHFEGRSKRRLGDAVGMKNFGVNLATLERPVRAHGTRQRICVILDQIKLPVLKVE